MKRFIGTLIIIIAIGVFCYPTISSLYNSYLALKTIAKTTSNEITEKDYTEEIEKCNIYNNSLNKDTTVIIEKMNMENETYESLMNTNGNGVMGFIEIPKISQKLPIYHYTKDEELARGIGHIASSSLPVGGTSTNCILTGHRGLPNNLLFTRLDEMEEGDMIYISALQNTLAYKVYDIEVILPDDIDDIKIETGKDLVTLITCTPYSVNTHRLVIRAERIPFDEETYEPVSDTRAMLEAIPLTRFYISIGFVAFLVVANIVLEKKSKGKSE